MSDNTVPSRPVPPPLPTREMIPPALAELPRWIAWSYEWRENECKKQPYSAVTGVRKDWPNASVGFEEALVGAERLGADGVGFNPIESDGLTFLDFDDCILDGDLDPAVETWLKLFPGYKEVTPSGTGIRVAVKGRLPRNVTNHPLPDSKVGASVELYGGGSAHFVTITGNSWRQPHFTIGNGQPGIDKLLTHIGFDPKSEEAGGETTEQAAVRYFERNCKAAETLSTGRYVFLVRTCWWLGRVLGAKPKNPILTLENIQSSMEAAISKTGWTELRHIEGQLRAGQRKPVKLVNPEDRAKEALERIAAWLLSDETENPKHEDAYNDLALLADEEFARVRREVARRLKIKSGELDGFVRKRRGAAKTLAQTAVSNNLTEDQVRKALSDLLLTTKDERRALGLPESIEKASEIAENGLWQYIKENAQVFCTESGQGYLLFHAAKHTPVPVTRDGHELDAFLSNLGIHAGAGARNRIGKHLGNMCWREGMRVEPRISFHYDPVTFCAYFAENPGELIKVTASEITRVPNGCDGQLFLLPQNYDAWSIDLDNLPPPTDIGPDAYALLPELLFDVLEFENESLWRDDVEILLGAFTCTLFLPGIVSGKLLLLILGGTGSGKTLFARMLGRLIYGPAFDVTGMATAPDQFENALVNNSFLVLDDVKHTTDPAILGMIRRAVTGGKCVRRELYSTFGQVSEPYRATIAMTGSEEVFTGSDEMSNRELIVFAKQREDYQDEMELLKRIDANRNKLMAEMMVRLQCVIIAVKAQANFKPTVRLRMASFSTFLLRVARHWDWGDAALQLLDKWQEEQQGAVLDASIVEVLNLWLAEPGLEEGKRYSAGELHQQMVLASQRHGLSVPWWFSKGPALIRALRNGLHAYRRHFGFCFEGRTSGHRPATYWFDPKLRDAEAQKRLPAKQADIPF
jgi:hypothetical protein